MDKVIYFGYSRKTGRQKVIFTMQDIIFEMGEVSFEMPLSEYTGFGMKQTLGVIPISPPTRCDFRQLI